MANFVEDFVEKLGSSSKESFKEGRHILSYREYLSLVSEDPALHLRDAAGYVRDMFDCFGTREVRYPWGAATRYVLFDQPFGTKLEALSGQEDAQAAFYNILQSFVRAGRPHRLILLHGPNGSSKTTFVLCIARALEHYSVMKEGAVYRFNWVFPSEKVYGGGLGFMKKSAGGEPKGREYAHFDEDEIDAKLTCELKDHPLLLLPPGERKSFIERILDQKKLQVPVPELIQKGGVCPKCRLIFDALLSAYRGDLTQVYNHVQVERYTISKRYRRGFVSIGPQMSIDAGERQVTMDRSLAALPKVLQNISLFEPFGDLVDGSGGIIEFSDLLKRPVEAFKYLLETIETGDVQVGQSNQRVNAILVATSNEIHLNAFKQHPDALSFLGRLSMIKIPYILNEPVERTIYENQVVGGLGKHVAPHAVEIASSWAVMSRLFKPKPEQFTDPVKNLVRDLLCTEKFDIYAEGRIPGRFTNEETKLFFQSIDALYRETDNQPVYEGITGASPREVKSVLYIAAQNPSYECLTPMAVLEELESFIKRTKDYSFLNMEKKEGHYHDFKHFIDILRIRLIQKLLMEAVEASGLFAKKQFDELWDRYVVHASTWIKDEKIYNPITKKHESPDESLMDRIENLLEVKDKKEFRQEILSRIAAAAIEKSPQKGIYALIFSRQIETLRSQMIKESLPKLRDLVESAIAPAAGPENKAGISEDAKAFLASFQSMYGYCPACARVALGHLMSEKLAL